MVREQDLRKFRCIGSVYGEHDAGRDGTCRWCGKRVAPSMPKPQPRPVVSEIDHYYRTMWDPDYEPGEYHHEYLDY